MTTIMVNVRDDAKVNDVVSFLRDIDFLEVVVKDEVVCQKMRRRPAPELSKTRIVGDIMEPVVPDSNWESVRESNS